MRYIYLLFLVLLCFGCSRPYSQYVEQINSVSPTLLKTFDSIVIIPNEGCGGCISSATNYFLENISKHENSVVVFTGIKDMKLFKLMLPKIFIDHKNVLIDKKNYLKSLDVSSIYPQLITVKKNEIETVKILNIDEFNK